LTTVALSVLVAHDAPRAIFQVFLMAQFGLLYLYIVRFVRDREEILFVAAMLIAGVLLESLLMIGLRIHNESFEISLIQFRIDPDDATRVAGTFVAPVAAAAYLSLLLAPALTMSIFSQEKLVRLMAFLAVCFGIVALYLTLSRGALLTFAMSTLIVCGMLWLRNWMRAGIPLILMAAFGVLAIANYESLASRFFGDDHGSAAGRVPLNTIAMRIIADHPLMGIGANNFAVVGLQYATTPDLRDEWFQTVHNKYLLVCSEIGIGGLLAFLILLFVTLWRGWQAWQSGDRQLASLALAFTVALACQMTHMMVDRFNNRSDEQAFWTVAALISAIYFVRADEQC
jgi:O-antigen ligase